MHIIIENGGLITFVIIVALLTYGKIINDREATAMGSFTERREEND